MVFKAGTGDWMGRRFWESRQFYSAYIALFVAITNWITIQYKLLLENIPFLNIVFSNIWIFMIVAAIVFTVISILGGHYVHRKRQFRIEQAMATEENPYLYLAAPGKERDLFLPIAILQLETLEELLRNSDTLTQERRERFEKYKEGLLRLVQGRPYTKMWT
jgi:hypothetical protein